MDSAPNAFELKPQPGPQMEALASPADFVIFGGAAFGGKTYALLMEPLRHVKNPKFTATIFRRNETDVTKQGGLWDTAGEIYPAYGGVGSKSELEYKFPSGMRVQFAGMKDVQDREKWQGSQIAFIGWDEATHFDVNQVTYMFSRNRSNSGVPGYMFLTCNPDPDSFVAEWIDWYLDDDGFPIKERCGKIRYFIRRGHNLIFADTRDELVLKFGADQEPKSLTFIPALAKDNPIGIAGNPGYMSNLKAMSQVDRARLLDGNWKVRAVAGSYFKREWFPRTKGIPAIGIAGSIRFWDRAATELTDSNDPDQTCCIKMLKLANGRYLVVDYKTMFATPHDVDAEMVKMAEDDGPETTIGWMKDPGSAGIKESNDTAVMLSKYPLFILEGSKAQKSKEIRCKPVSSQCQVGNVAILDEVPWFNNLMRNLEGFPDGRYKEEADCMSGAHDGLNSGPAPKQIPPREHDWGVRRSSRMVV